MSQTISDNALRQVLELQCCAMLFMFTKKYEKISSATTAMMMMTMMMLMTSQS
jgi:hypothetical protein